MKKLLFLLTILFISAACMNNGNNNPVATSGNSQEGLEPGMKAPELEYASPNGEKIALSSLRGKMVLIDFWASWCPPCRRENPIVATAYRKFKNAEFKGGSGFTVYSVSFDRTKENWLEAIAKDGLSWPTHVSELKGWDAEAGYTYNINEIPSNFLIDGNGIILAQNLYGDSLQTTLSRLLK